MYTGCNLKTTEFLDCALIGVCAVIRSNTVYKNINENLKEIKLKQNRRSYISTHSLQIERGSSTRPRRLRENLLCNYYNTRRYLVNVTINKQRLLKALREEIVSEQKLTKETSHMKPSMHEQLRTLAKKPSRHTTFVQQRIDVDATSQRCVPAGKTVSRITTGGLKPILFAHNLNINSYAAANYKHMFGLHLVLCLISETSYNQKHL